MLDKARWQKAIKEGSIKIMGRRKIAMTI